MKQNNQNSTGGNNTVSSEDGWYEGLWEVSSPARPRASRPRSSVLPPPNVRTENPWAAPGRLVGDGRLYELENSVAAMNLDSRGRDTGAVARDNVSRVRGESTRRMERQSSASIQERTAGKKYFGGHATFEDPEVIYGEQAFRTFPSVDASRASSLSLRGIECRTIFNSPQVSYGRRSASTSSFSDVSLSSTSPLPSQAPRAFGELRPWSPVLDCFGYEESHRYIPQYPTRGTVSTQPPPTQESGNLSPRRPVPSRGIPSSDGENGWQPRDNIQCATHQQLPSESEGSVEDSESNGRAWIPCRQTEGTGIPKGWIKREPSKSESTQPFSKVSSVYERGLSFRPSYQAGGKLSVPFQGDIYKNIAESRPKYKGRTTPYDIYNAGATEEENCAVRIEGIDRAALLSDIFGLIRTGKVYAFYLQRANNQYSTCAANVVFMRHQAAARFVQTRNNTSFRRRTLRVIMNNNRARPRPADKMYESRVVRFTGPNGFISLAMLEALFKDYIVYDLVNSRQWFDKERGVMVVDMAFSSIRAQSEAVVRIFNEYIEKEGIADNYSCNYAHDPCDPSGM
ncbi:hypothetical protein B7494_g1679 [Chlorociboria aeruginascens]|nr:hypothetical protein B7494_g1679 [Chlorociboria aeruginascens]